MNTQTQRLRAVALFEAGKGALALLIAAALALAGPHRLQLQLEKLFSLFHFHGEDPRTELLQHVSTHNLHIAIVILAAYTTIRLLEAWGLWHHRAWASWLGCIGAAIYLPLEIHTLWQHPHWLTGSILSVNLLIVAVLARDLWVRHGR